MPLNADGSLQGDQYGFLILGHARLENGISHVYGDTQDILRLLRQGDADSPLNAPISQLTEAIRDLSQTRRTRAPRRATGGAANGGNPPSIVPDAPELPIVRDAANSDTAPRPAPDMPPQPTPNDSAQDDKKKKDKDDDKDGKDKSLIESLRDTLRINADASHIDLTIDAIRELGGMFAPVAKVGKLSLRGAKWLFGKVKKAPPPSDQEQRQLNRIERLLKGVRDGLNKPSNEMMLALAAAAAVMTLAKGREIVDGMPTAAADAIGTVVTNVLALTGDEKAKETLRLKEEQQRYDYELKKGIPNKTANKMDATELAHSVMADFGNESSKKWLRKNRPDNNRGYDKPEDWYIANRVPMPSRGNSNTGLPVAPVSGGAGNQPKIVKILEVGSGYNIVEMSDGSIVKRVGDRNWRNNGGGNLRYTGLTKSYGALGSDAAKNGFSIFESAEAGATARQRLIFESSAGKKSGTNADYGAGLGYKDKLLTQAITAYAPPEDSNDTAKYQRHVLAAVGGKNLRMRDYSMEERRLIGEAIRTHEGTRKGKEIVLRKPTAPTVNPPKPTTPVAAPAKVAAPEVNTAPSPKPQPAKPAQPQMSSMNKVSTPKPQVVTIAPDNSMIAQNVSDRALAHAITGGLGMERFVG